MDFKSAGRGFESCHVLIFFFFLFSFFFALPPSFCNLMIKGIKMIFAEIELSKKGIENFKRVSPGGSRTQNLLIRSLEPLPVRPPRHLLWETTTTTLIFIVLTKGFTYKIAKTGKIGTWDYDTLTSLYIGTQFMKQNQNFELRLWFHRSISPKIWSFGTSR